MSNPRINITLEKNIIDALNFISKKTNRSVSAISKDLIIDSLERREDIALSKLADLRDNENTISHDEAWK